MICLTLPDWKIITAYYKQTLKQLSKDWPKCMWLVLLWWPQICVRPWGKYFNTKLFQICLHIWNSFVLNLWENEGTWISYRSAFTDFAFLDIYCWVVYYMFYCQLGNEIPGVLYRLRLGLVSLVTLSVHLRRVG